LPFVAAIEWPGLGADGWDEQKCGERRGKKCDEKKSVHVRSSREIGCTSWGVGRVGKIYKIKFERAIYLNRLSSRPGWKSFEVGADDLDDVVGGFFGGFGVAGHVISNVIFHEFSHEAIDGAAGCGEALEGVGARLVFIEGAQNAFELADDFFSAVDEIEFFSGGVGHFPSLPYRGMESKVLAIEQGALAQ
jgi:hypothetical protein